MIRHTIIALLLCAASTGWGQLTEAQFKNSCAKNAVKEFSECYSFHYPANPRDSLTSTFRDSIIDMCFAFANQMWTIRSSYTPSSTVLDQVAIDFGPALLPENYDMWFYNRGAVTRDSLFNWVAESAFRLGETYVADQLE